MTCIEHHTARALSPLTALIGALLVSGCGGATSSHDDDEPSGGGAAASSGSGGSSAAQAGAASNGGEPATPGNPLGEVAVDDIFTWFVAGPGEPGQLFEPEGEPGNRVVHVLLEDDPVWASISTHNLVDVVSHTTRVRFRAKAAKALPLLVSVRSGIGRDYFTDRDDGEEWPSAVVAAAPEWRAFDVPFTDMHPKQAPSDDGGRPAFVIAFVLDGVPGPVELWLDEVRFE